VVLQRFRGELVLLDKREGGSGFDDAGDGGAGFVGSGSGSGSRPQARPQPAFDSELDDDVPF
jgi:single-strand DNA-binding protein